MIQGTGRQGMLAGRHIWIMASAVVDERACLEGLV